MLRSEFEWHQACSTSALLLQALMLVVVVINIVADVMLSTLQTNLVISECVLSEEMNVVGELFNIIVLLILQLVLNSHHINRIVHNVVILRLVPKQNSRNTFKGWMHKNEKAYLNNLPSFRSSNKSFAQESTIFCFTTSNCLKNFLANFQLKDDASMDKLLSIISSEYVTHRIVLNSSFAFS